MNLVKTGIYFVLWILFVLILLCGRNSQRLCSVPSAQVVIFGTVLLGMFEFGVKLFFRQAFEVFLQLMGKARGQPSVYFVTKMILYTYAWGGLLALVGVVSAMVDFRSGDEQVFINSIGSSLLVLLYAGIIAELVLRPGIQGHRDSRDSGSRDSGSDLKN